MSGTNDKEKMAMRGDNVDKEHETRRKLFYGFVEFFGLDRNII